jgi:hypothetical protein
MINNQKRKKIIKKLNEIQAEILLVGWNGIIEKYHPDFNIDDEDANNVFKLYKHVYENMKQRVSINSET